ncbi:hypothetical protein GH714_010781 [Hevea brasiliensis]|uniref:Dirigent protein n=1 Tax=Hevea brasiliensis TaxID=3981 RepID=A0A6A6MI36_HEVBR|nr:hypothetical protein GH714_010781 [Hevea brasiliensis]
MVAKRFFLALFFVLLLLSKSYALYYRKNRARKPCKRLIFYFHDIIYNGKNTKNATSAIVGAPAWANKTILAGQSHFGDLVVFDDPITLDNNLHSTPVGRAQGIYVYDKKEIFTAWLGFSFVFNSTEHKGSINFAGADPLMNKTRDISVIGGTGDFFMARGVATLMTDAFEGEVYFRLRVDVNLYPKQWCENPIEEAFRHVLQTISKNLDGLEVRGLDCQNSQAMTESMLVLDDFYVSKKSTSKHNSTREYQMKASTKSYVGLLKFVLLFGYLTLQGSHQAFAGTDFASGLQSLPYLGDLGDITTGFASAFLLIFFSELGDKTFFIAALLAARNSAAIVFTGTFGALAAMTIISVVLGRSFHYIDEILPFKFGENDLPVDDIAAVCLLAELAVSEFAGNGAGILAAANTIISTFLLVFVAEWGDKSFFSTIALAAASSPIGVIGGALAGHGVATLIAVLGGSLLGTFLSEKTTAYIGGILFLVFAAVTLIEIVS